jgi:nucleoside-diphosphate-sugar epimerase
LKLEDSLSGDGPLTVNIGSGVATSIRTLAEKITASSGKHFNLVFNKSMKTGPLSRTADTSKADSTLEWSPRTGLDEGLKRTYDWAYRKLKN